MPGATGTFEVKLEPQVDSGQEAAAIGRLIIDKQFRGDLQATSKGQMLSAAGNITGSAGYVAIERVTGTLHGKSGTFALQHNGTMNRGAPQLTVSVIPDSATGDLEGLTGNMQIVIDDRGHSYNFTYSFSTQHGTSNNADGQAKADTAAASSNGGTVTRAEFLKELQEENAGWEALLREIGEDRMQSGIQEGGWTVKDIVAHITGWRVWTVRRLQAALKHEPDAPQPWPANLRAENDDDLDKINDWIYRSNKDRSLKDVLQDSRDTFDQLYAALEAFPEEELQDLTRLDWLEGEPITGALFFGHFHDEHEAALRAWAENK